jgi:hypothetical protein
VPALLAVGGGDEGLLQRLIDGVQRRLHGLFIDQTVKSPAIGSRHHRPPAQLLTYSIMSHDGAERYR